MILLLISSSARNIHIIQLIVKDAIALHLTFTQGDCYTRKPYSVWFQRAGLQNGKWLITESESWKSPITLNNFKK